MTSTLYLASAGTSTAGCVRGEYAQSLRPIQLAPAVASDGTCGGDPSDTANSARPDDIIEMYSQIRYNYEGFGHGVCRMLLIPTACGAWGSYVDEIKVLIADDHRSSGGHAQPVPAGEGREVVGRRGWEEA